MFKFFKSFYNDISNIIKTQKEYSDQIEMLRRRCEQLNEALKKKEDKEVKEFKFNDEYEVTLFNDDNSTYAYLTMNLNPNENLSGFSIPKDIPLLIKDIELLQDAAIDYLKELKGNEEL